MLAKRLDNMALRLIEISLPKVKLQAVEEIVSGRSEVLDIIMQPAVSSWKISIMGELKTRLSTDYVLIRILVLAESSQSLLDLLEETFSDVDGFRINIFALEASFPPIISESTNHNER